MISSRAQALEIGRYGHRVFAKLKDTEHPDVRVRQRRGDGRRARACAALSLPHAVGGGRSGRAARGVPRARAGLGWHAAAAEPHRRHQRRPGDRAEPADAEQDAAPGQAHEMGMSDALSSPPTSSNGRWSGPLPWLRDRSQSSEPTSTEARCGTRSSATRGSSWTTGSMVRRPRRTGRWTCSRSAKERVLRRRCRRRGRGSRRPADERRAPQWPLRLRPRAAAGQAARRGAELHARPRRSPRSAWSAPDSWRASSPCLPSGDSRCRWS